MCNSARQVNLHKPITNRYELLRTTTNTHTMDAARTHQRWRQELKWSEPLEDETVRGRMKREHKSRYRQRKNCLGKQTNTQQQQQARTTRDGQRYAMGSYTILMDGR